MRIWLKWAIVGLIFIIVILGTVIYFVLNDNKDDGVRTGMDLNTVEENVVIEEISEWTDVPNLSLAYSIQYCIQRYYSYGSEGNSEALYNSLDKEYVSKNGVSKENVLDVLNMKRNIKFVVCNVKYLENENITAFQVEGMDLYANGAVKRYYVVKVDFEGNKFSIYPTDKMEEDVKLTNTINSSDDNIFESVNLTEEQEARQYLINFKYQALYNSEDLFNKFDKQIWSSYDEFKSFVAKFKFSEVVRDYSVNYNNSYTEYFITDSLGNKLAFIVKSAMNYSVRVI